MGLAPFVNLKFGCKTCSRGRVLEAIEGKNKISMRAAQEGRGDRQEWILYREVELKQRAHAPLLAVGELQ